MATPRQARRLRRRSTDAERVLWARVRDRQLAGLKFRRQQPLGPYVVDFVCFEHRLIIELDGGQHARQADNDSRRDGWLSDNGYRVLRFWNDEVHGNIDGVLDAIARVAAAK